MNKVETLLKDINVGGVLYMPQIYVTAFGRWCVSYCQALGKNESLCSVCVEPENAPRRIEDTIGCLNEYIGNAKTLDDAVDMINEYIKTLV